MSDDYTTTIETTGAVAIGGSATGNIETAGDRDWFAVEFEAGRTYQIDLRGSPTGDGTLPDTFLRRILDAEGNKSTGDGSNPTYNDNYGGSVNSRVTFTAVESGRYYIEASGDRDETGTYTLSVTDVTPVSSEEPQDQEPPVLEATPPPVDTDAGRAGAVDLGDITGQDGPLFPTNTLDGGDDRIDYYRFTLSEAKQVSLGLRQQDANADLFLEDEDGAVLHSSAAAGTSNEWLSATLLAGTYYVRVEAQEAGQNDHVFRYGVSAPDADEVARLEQQQQGDTNAPPAFGQQSYAFDLAENADGSVNRVALGTVSATDPESAALTYSIEGGNEADLFEIDASTGALSYAGSGEDYESETTSYELTVRASDGTNSADVTVTVNVTDVQEQTVADPDGAREGATDLGDIADLEGPLFPTNTLDGGDDRIDYYRFELSEAKKVSLGLRLQDANADLFLEDEDGAVLHSSAAAGTSNEWLSATLLAGTYYVRVEAQESGENAHVFRYGVGEADAGEVTRLEAEQSGGPAIRVADAQAHEEDGTLRFRVTLDQAATGPVTVRYATSDGTAVAGEDYESASGVLTFAEGETEQWVEVTLIDDAVEDSGETLTLTLSDASGGWLADAAGAGTILNTEHTTSVSEPQGGDLPGNTSTAGRVAVGESATGRINSTTDRDWFAVTLQAGRSYSIDLEGVATSAGTLWNPNITGVYDSNGNRIGYTGDEDGGVGLNSRVGFEPEADGTYYIEAEGHGNSGGTYRLSVTDLGAEFAADTTTTGRVEVDGSVRSAIGSRHDADWFAVTLEAGQAYRIDLQGFGANRGSLDDPMILGIYDSDGNLMPGTSDDDGGPIWDSRVYFEPEDGGTYYISAYGDSGDTGTYRLAVTELDDDYRTGTGTNGAVDVGGSATGRIGHRDDIDWFAVELVAGREYRVDVEGYYTDVGTLVDPYLYGIYDADGDWIRGTSDDDGGAIYNSKLFFRPEATGTHYVAAGANVGDTGTYKVSVTDLTGIDDHGNNEDGAGTVAVGRSVTGEIERVGDEDWYAVTLEGGKSYRFDLEGWDTYAGTLVDSYLVVWTGGYEHVGGRRTVHADNDSGPGLSSRVYWTPNEDGTYYIFASGHHGDTGTYTLSVEEVI